MAGDSVLRDALERFKREHLGDKEKEQFQFTDLSCLKASIKELQDKQAPKQKMRNWARLGAFLEGMEQYEKLIEVFLNANGYLAFVWVSTKLRLGRPDAYLFSVPGSYEVSAAGNEQLCARI